MRTTLASYEVAQAIGKAMAPYQHSELVKECMVRSMKALFPDKKDIHDTINKVPLSRQTCARRIEDIANHLSNKLLQDLEKCESFSLALDETNDISDIAQLSVFVRYFKEEKFQEQLLTVISLHGRTTGKDIFEQFKLFMDTNNIPFSKIIGVATDGAPAMVGRHIGFIKYLQDINSGIIACHCIIHETMLCAKLKDEYADLMTHIMKLVNYLKAKSGLRHRELCVFLQSLDAKYNELLTHNNVRLVDSIMY